MAVDKRRAVVAGALSEFGRNGYGRTSIDAIARAAGVSTRTIYQYFDGKADLFETVIRESATPVADAQIAIIDYHLHKIVDLEADLVAFGVDLATPMVDHADHFALVQHVNADLAHIPQAAIDAWEQAGPRRVLSTLAAHLRRIADEGSLDLDDPTDSYDPAEQAATHFMLLVQGAVPFHHGVGANEATRLERTVRAGVRVFLHGYQP